MNIVKLKEAAQITGLSVWELRTGAASGKYPAMRVGGSHGRLLFDVELLNDKITKLMASNCERENENSECRHIRRIDV